MLRLAVSRLHAQMEADRNGNEQNGFFSRKTTPKEGKEEQGGAVTKDRRERREGAGARNGPKERGKMALFADFGFT